jgi:NAD(P)-dependent dehydrogenase (short-subunit alcohol dehydrogenase family)
MKVVNSTPDLTGKTVVVTGGAGILGQKFCEGFAEAGANIALVDLSADAAKSMAAGLGDHIFGFGCDITDPVSVQQTVKDIVKQTGRIDILMNNAASKSRDVRSFFAPFEDYDPAIWRDVMDVNVNGMFLMTQAVGRQLLAQGTGGSIINIASIYGLVGPDPRIYEGSEYLGGPINTPAVYSASKAAVVGFTKWLSTYLGSQNIRANCLVPGGVSSGQNGLFQQNYSSRVPMGRMAEAHEIVAPAVFLASDMASYITGQALVVDGGWTAW